MAKATGTTKTVIDISMDDAGWAMDAMRARADAYERTAEYLKTERFDGEPFEIEEVKDDTEARAIAKSYRDVIRRFEAAVKASS